MGVKKRLNETNVSFAVVPEILCQLYSIHCKISNTPASCVFNGECVYLCVCACVFMTGTNIRITKNNKFNQFNVQNHTKARSPSKVRTHMPTQEALTIRSS